MLSRSLLVRYGCVLVTPRCRLPNEWTIPSIYDVIYTSPQYSQGVDQTIRRLLTNTLSTTRGKYSSVDEYLLQITRRVFVRGTNILSKTWGNYSSHGPTPSPTHGANIRPLDEHPLQTWGKYYSSFGRISSAAHRASIPNMDEYPHQEPVGQVLARGRIVPIRRMDLSGIRKIYSCSCGVFATQPATL